MRNSLGNILRLTTFGESHGPAVGGVLDGCPPGIIIEDNTIKEELKRRRTGSSFFTSARREPDEVEFLSGLLKGRTTGAPIAFMVRNKDARPADYKNLRVLYRPSHADFTWDQKFGFHDIAGGGRSSARVMLPCVVAGVIAKGILKPLNCTVLAWVSAIGPYSMNPELVKATQRSIEASPVRCPDAKTSEKMIKYLKELYAKGDTAGGIITCTVSGLPAGLGEPVFEKLHAALAHAMMNINSVKGFEYGAGFGATSMKGSEYNDAFTTTDGRIRTVTNNDGGIQGGITNGENIIFRIAFKPVSSIGLRQQTVSRHGKPASVRIKGRHDSCVVPRAVPIVEAMTRLVIADHYLMQKTRCVR
jgi:chorismate synthase